MARESNKELREKGHNLEYGIFQFFKARKGESNNRNKKLEKWANFITNWPNEEELKKNKWGNLIANGGWVINEKTGKKLYYKLGK